MCTKFTTLTAKNTQGFQVRDSQDNPALSALTKEGFSPAGANPTIVFLSSGRPKSPLINLKAIVKNAKKVQLVVRDDKLNEIIKLVVRNIMVLCLVKAQPNSHGALLK